MAEGAVAAVSEQALLDTQRAFDGVAATYGESNAANRTLCEMRARTLAAFVTRAPAGARLLDLGCGPGSDAEQLARNGFSVTAIDWSRAMVDEARRRVHGAGLTDRVEVHHLGIHELHRLAPQTFDAACSNFGPLNCVPSLAEAARLIGDRLRPGGILAASVIGRVCPWEIGLYLLKGDWARAVVRFRREPVPVPLEGHTVWMRYYSPRTFERVFEDAGFTRVSLRALGLFAPPPYMNAFAERNPSTLGWLHRLDDAVGGVPGLRAWGDHFLVVLKKW
jgi:SAM-dependent methyltransferase